MNSLLAAKFSFLKRNTDFLLKNLENYDLEILQKKPDENQWSVIQVLNHLIMSETGSLNCIKYNIISKFYQTRTSGNFGVIECQLYIRPLIIIPK